MPVLCVNASEFNMGIVDFFLFVKEYLRRQFFYFSFRNPPLVRLYRWLSEPVRHKQTMVSIKLRGSQSNTISFKRTIFLCDEATVNQASEARQLVC
jgi:hypothetical protein